ncbi:MAG: hypothetical protein LBC73_07210 [Oscillospiraceae bacterium]|jgi:hypothetical protein|nr:hypothetical protein [Oscillospiraceae bacterium]
MFKKRFALVLAVMMLFSITMNFSVSASSEHELLSLDDYSCSSDSNTQTSSICILFGGCWADSVNQSSVSCPSHCKCTVVTAVVRCIVCDRILSSATTHTNQSKGHVWINPSGNIWVCKDCGFLRGS